MNVGRSPNAWLFLTVACTPAPLALRPISEPPAAAPTVSETPRASSSRRCPVPPESVDVRDLLARHARAFGSPSAYEASLPRTDRGDVEGAPGDTWIETADLHARRNYWFEEGGEGADGIDATGPWRLYGSGAFIRLAREEALTIRFEDWVERRQYLREAGWRAVCTDDPAGGAPPRVTLALETPALGSVSLLFDLETAALLERTNGWGTKVRIDAWSAPDARGLRVPLREMNERSGTVNRKLESRAGLFCDGQTGPLCLKPHTPASRLVWPAGSPVVRVPLKLRGEGHFAVPAQVNGRDIVVLFDSSDQTTMIDSRSKTAEAVVPFRNASSTGDGDTRYGQLPELRIGGLTLENLSVRVTSLAMLDSLGAPTPEVFVGGALFENAAVRFDYVAAEASFAKTAAALVHKGAVPLPIRFGIFSYPLVQARLGDSELPLIVCTGNDSPLSVYRDWAESHGLVHGELSQRRGHFNEGAEETTLSTLPVKGLTVGPIARPEGEASVYEGPREGDTGGILGAPALASCQAVTFDYAGRKLWIEGPCDRAVDGSTTGP